MFECYLLGEKNTIFPHDVFDEGIFSRMSVSVHCMCPKNAFVGNAFFFIKLSVSACIPTFIKTYPRKRRSFYSVFDSVIALYSLSHFCLV